MAMRIVHRRRRKVGGIDTGTVLLIGAGAVALYLFTRPKSAPMAYQNVPGLPGVMVPFNPNAAASASTTNTAITQGASVVTDLINQLFG